MSSSRQQSVDVLIHCPGSHGVVPDQVHHQANALHDAGVKVHVLCSVGYARTRDAAYPITACMIEGATQNTSIWSRKVGKVLQTIRNQWRFAWEVYLQRPRVVLTASHTDTQSPFWIWPHMALASFLRIIYATNLHFSARDHALGPKWWNDFAARLSFNPFKIGIAHKRFSNPASLPRHMRVVEVPLGPDNIPQLPENPKSIRAKWKVPRGKRVLLAFGTIRNHKNIDLAIRALMDNPEVYLVVLGSVASHKDRPMKYYQNLADDLGLSGRVFISDDFVPDEKRLSYFRAADFILLTYNSAFHSQSATLATAVAARRRVLASSGTSPMRDLVEQFGLGIYVEPDSSDAVADGMATLIHSELPEPDWQGFEDHATWETNVTRLLESVADLVKGRKTPVRQFEGWEGEKPPAPALLNARQLNPKLHPRTQPRSKKPNPRQKPAPSSRKKATPPPEPVAAVVENHPVFPGFDALSQSSAPSKVNGNGHINGYGINGHGANGHGTKKAVEAKEAHEKPTVKRRGRMPRKLPLASQAA